MCGEVFAHGGLFLPLTSFFGQRTNIWGVWKPTL
jgi:hypothetical protein